MNPTIDQLSDADLGALVRETTDLDQRLGAAVRAVAREAAREAVREALPRQGPLHDPEELLKPADVAKFLKLSPRTLAEWRREGNGPAFEQISHGHIRYRRAALAEWARSREVASTSDASA